MIILFYFIIKNPIFKTPHIVQHLSDIITSKL